MNCKVVLEKVYWRIVGGWCSLVGRWAKFAGVSYYVGMDRISKLLWNVIVVIGAGMMLWGCQADEDVRKTPTGTPLATAVPLTFTPIPSTSTPLPTNVSELPSPTRIEVATPATPEPTATPLLPTPTMIPLPTQPITLPGPIGASQIAYQVGGSILAVEVIGNVAYVGVGPRLYVLDVSDPANVLVMGVSGMLPGVIGSLVVDEGVVFAATVSDGVWLLDVNDPSHPVPLSTIPTIYGRQKLALYEGYLLVVDQNGGYPDAPIAELFVFDVSDYENPVQRFKMDLPDVVSAFAFYDQYIYLSVGESAVTSDPGLLILDAAALPELEKAVFLTEFASSESMLVDNSTLYHSSGPVLVSYDLADPLNPVEIHNYGRKLFSDTDIGKIENAILVTEVFCELGACGGGLQIYPLNRPPEQTDIYQVNAGFFPYDLSVAGDWVYIASGSQLFIYDLSNVLSPRLVSRWKGSGYMDLVGEDGDRLFAFDEDERTISYYDLETADRPSFINQQKLDDWITSLVFPTNLDYVIWGGSYDGVVIAEKEEFEAIASIENPAFLEQYGSHVLYNNSGLVFAILNRGLVIVDISEPAQPILTYPAEWLEDEDFSYTSIFWQEPYLYAVNGNGRVAILDVEDPTSPREIGWFEIGRRACEMVVEGDFIYVLAGTCNVNGDATSELVIVDGSEPGNMRIVGSVVVPGVMRDLAVFGDQVFIANGDVAVVDVAVRSQPRLINTVTTPGNAADLVVIEDLLYVADGAGGVIVIKPSVVGD